MLIEIIIISGINQVNISKKSFHNLKSNLYIKYEEIKCYTLIILT